MMEDGETCTSGTSRNRNKSYNCNGNDDGNDDDDDIAITTRTYRDVEEGCYCYDGNNNGDNGDGDGDAIIDENNNQHNGDDDDDDEEDHNEEDDDNDDDDTLLYDALDTNISNTNTNNTHANTLNSNYSNYSNHNNNQNHNDNISFRSVLPEDRTQIQELFEEWFPVEYKDDFYENLCNRQTMGAQKLYTLVATTTTTTKTTENERNIKNSDDDQNHNQNQNHHDSPTSPRIIACLLGCKLNARKLNEASRELLIPGYSRRRNINGNNGNNDNDNGNYSNNTKIDKVGDDNENNKNNKSDDNINDIDTYESENDDDNDNDNDNGNDNDSSSFIDLTEVFYIMTLGVIQEYRKQGLASYLVERALEDQIVVAVNEDDEDDEDQDEHEDEHEHEHEDFDEETAGDYDAYDDIYCHHKSNNQTRSRQQRRRRRDKIRTTALSSTEMYSPHHNCTNCNCETAYLHVIIKNDAAIRFYEKLGFQRLREIADYYTIDDEKHNCYLYAKFFDRESNIDRNNSNNNNNNDNIGRMRAIKVVVSRLISSIWSSLSYYWVVDDGDSTAVEVV